MGQTRTALADHYAESRSPVMRATANLVGSGAVQRRLGAAAPTYPELRQRRRNAGIKTPTQVELERDSVFTDPGGQLLREETQFESDLYEDALPKKIDPDRRGRLRTGHEGSKPI